VKAFVVVPGAEPSEQLAIELKRFVGTRLAIFKVPREIAFAPSLPRTPNGKLRRRELATLVQTSRSGG
jgi:acyl-coenzyme A synthetase/AMP-(fatty) acid ligase